MVDVHIVHKEGQRIGAVDRLDELVKIQHVDADAQLVLAIIVLKLVGLELEVHQHNVRSVHGYDFQPGLVELDARVREQLLEGFDQDLERRRLNRLDL